MGFDYSLSASKLNLLKECRRCFYDANVLKIERPRGIFPSLPGGVDRVMKEYMDRHRGKLPLELCQDLTGKLWGSVSEITKLRHWKSGLKTLVQVGTKTVSLIGALDDLILEPNHTFSAYDTKTKGDLPKDDGSQYYQLQLDVYGLLLQSNGMTPSGKGYLCYWYPVAKAGEGIEFRSKLYTLTVDPARAVADITDAVNLMQGGQPDHNPACEFCRFAQKRVEAAMKAVAQPMSLTA